MHKVISIHYGIGFFMVRNVKSNYKGSRFSKLKATLQFLCWFWVWKDFAAHKMKCLLFVFIEAGEESPSSLSPPPDGGSNEWVFLPPNYHNSEETTWTCTVCTFANHEALEVCEMCDMPRNRALEARAWLKRDSRTILNVTRAWLFEQETLAGSEFDAALS